jgi:mono/diheme cytochrome c family protein
LRSLKVILPALLAVTWMRIAASEEACSLPAMGARARLFNENCTVCHGVDGKGGGPLAKALNLSPPDLTTLKRREGIFPSGHVLNVLRNGAGTTSEGDKAMPVWSKIFAHECGEAFAQEAVTAITQFIKEIQVP